MQLPSDEKKKAIYQQIPDALARGDVEALRRLADEGGNEVLAAQ